MKYNLSLLKNKNVGFQIYRNDEQLRFCSIVKSVKQTKNGIIFNFENSSLEISLFVFEHMLVRLDEKNNIVWLIQDKDCSYFTSFLGFTMFDTYGFPIEMTQEIVCEKNMKIDIDGFYVLRKLKKQMSMGTYKNKNAFKGD